MLRGHVEAGDHHQVGFAEVDSGLQTVRHGLQGLQILQRVQFVGLLQLDWGRTDGEQRRGRVNIGLFQILFGC